MYEKIIEIIDRDERLLFLQALLNKYTFFAILLSVLATVSMTIAYLLNAAPVYISTSQIMIKSDKQKSFLDQLGGAVPVSDSGVQSELQVLRSPYIAGLVLKKLKIKTLFPDLATRSDLSNTEKHNRAVSALGKNLKTKLIGLSNVISISYMWRDPQTATNIANAFANVYIEEKINVKIKSVTKSQTWLQKRIAEIRGELLEATKKLQKSKTRIDQQALVSEFESQVATYQRIYGSYLQAYIESIQRQTYRTTNARIISPATKPYKKSAPKSRLLLMLALIGGGCFGLFLSLVRYALSD